MQFTDLFVESVLGSGYRIFIQYEIDDEITWTQSNTFHATLELADAEVIEILREGIIDMKDGVQRHPDIRKIIVQHFPMT